MNMNLRAVTVLVVCLCGAPSAPAQGTGPAGPASAVHRSVAVWSQTDEITAEGAGYQVRFRDGGFTFRTATVDAPHRALDVSFRLLSAARRGGPDGGIVADPVTPTLDGTGEPVRYSRGGLVETYELRADGVKQSFVFSELPPGDGDLVVRGALETVLPVAHAANDELRFGTAGRGGVRIGAVSGIDADGARVAGTLHYAAGVLEMTLPAEFVDSAALPLVLDPLIGSTTEVTRMALAASPDLAFDRLEDVYLVVWSSLFGVRAQRVDEDGALVGLPIALGDFGHFGPSVVNVTYSHMFFVVWEDQNDDIWAATVDPATGSVPSRSRIQGDGADSFASPDVGAATRNNTAVVVWNNTTQSRIQAQRILVQLSGGFGLYSPVDITPGSYADAAPAIAKSAGDGNRFLICWERIVSGQGQIRGSVVDTDLNVLDTWIDIAGTAREERNPAVDGDGAFWVVAYESEATPSSGDKDVACVGVAWDPAANAGYVHSGEVVVEGDLNDDEHDPAVAWMGQSALVAFADQTSFGDYDAYVVSVDPFHCLPCEGEFTLAATRLDEDRVAVASQASSGGSSSAAMLAWHAHDIDAGTFGIDATRFVAEAGVQSTSIGQCGAEADVRVTCAAAGNAAFTIRIMHTTPVAQVHLIVSPSTISLRCNSCRLVADPFAGVVFAPGITDARGNAAATFAIPDSPSLVGRSFWMQWLVSGSSCIGLDFSRAYSIRIQ